MLHTRIARHVPGDVRHWARKLGESSALAALEPVDYAARVINGKRAYPPLRVRARSGPLRSFESASASFVGFVSATCGLSPSDRVLDVGCGCGSVALQLLGFFEDGGGYTGLDVDRNAIRWARRELTRRDPRLRFVLADVANSFYNPSGARAAGSYSIPAPDASFHLALAKSLFTHMRPDGVENYIREIARVLCPGGHAVMTFFLRSPERDRLIARGQSPAFPYGAGAWRYADERVPEGAIAYDESYVLELLDRHRLALARPILRAHQDVIVVRAATA